MFQFVNSKSAKIEYTYTLLSNTYVDTYVWSKAAKFVDGVITAMLLDKLRETFDPEVWSQTLDAFSERFNKTRKHTATRIRELERAMQSHIASLDTLTNPVMIRAVLIQGRRATLQSQAHPRRRDVPGLSEAEGGEAVAGWAIPAMTGRLVSRQNSAVLSAIPLGSILRCRDWGLCRISGTRYNPATFCN